MAVKWQEVYGAVISSTYMSMTRGTTGIKGAKEGLRRLLTETTEEGDKPWRKFVIRGGDGSVLEDTTHNPLRDLREFIESEPLRGLGVSVSDVERLLSDDPEALAALREELKAKEWQRNPEGRNQHSKVIANNVSHNLGADLFTQPEPEHPKPKHKTEHGNRKDYTLTRLKKDAPELFEAVKAGNLSANAAALQAGIRKPHRSIPIDSPESAIKALTRVFSLDEIIAAAGRLADGQEADRA